ALDFRKERIPAGLWHDISREGLARHGPSGADRRRRVEDWPHGREVAASRGQSGNRGDVAVAESDADSVVAAEQEGFVFADRASQGSAELVLAEGRLGRAVQVGKEVRRVQIAVADELVGRAVQLVRSGFQ